MLYALQCAKAETRAYPLSALFFPTSAKPAGSIDPLNNTLLIQTSVPIFLFTLLPDSPFNPFLPKICCNHVRCLANQCLWLLPKDMSAKAGCGLFEQTCAAQTLLTLFPPSWHVIFHSMHVAEPAQLSRPADSSHGRQGERAGRASSFSNFLSQIEKCKRGWNSSLRQTCLSLTEMCSFTDTLHCYPLGCQFEPRCGRDFRRVMPYAV